MRAHSTYHEDVGYGHSENMPTDHRALEVALKTAVSDALKRTLRVFGEALGNSLYDKDFVREVRQGKHRDRQPITQVDTSWLGNGQANSASSNAGSLIEAASRSQSQTQSQPQ